MSSTDTSKGLSAHGLLLFRGDRCLLNEVSLQVSPGQGMVLRGPNGAGKTTLLRLLCGLTLPEEGQVCWEGIDISRQRDTWQRTLAWSGHKAGLKSELSVLENLQFSAALGGYTLPDIPTQLALDDCLHLPARVLSAGQQRRSSLARVLLSKSSVWILDEPYTNLDTQGQEYLNNCLGRHLGNGGLAIIASHGEAHAGLGLQQCTLSGGRLQC
jgi:heme exporter protein A